MLIKGLVDEDFVNYRKPSMFIATSYCDFKCCKDAGIDTSMCQNSNLNSTQPIDMSAEDIFLRYSSNDITSSIVFGGLEPMLQIDDILEIINYLRSNGINDDVVIYTGYNKDEVQFQINKLKAYDNIVVKFGRFVPNKEQKFDDVLGVNLASPNQYAERIS